MKKLFNLLCSFIMIVQFILPTYAQEQNKYYSFDNISSNWNELDPYVKIQNNSFYLDLPDNVELSSELYSAVTNHLSSINEEIKENDLTIDVKTRRVYLPNQTFSTRSYGKNAVYFHWNYLEIYLDAGMVQSITTTGVGALWGLAGIYTPILAAHPVITLSIGAIFSLVANAVASSGIKDGIVLHLNFLGGGVTYIGRQ